MSFISKLGKTKGLGSKTQYLEKTKKQNKFSNDDPHNKLFNKYEFLQKIMVHDL